MLTDAQVARTREIIAQYVTFESVKAQIATEFPNLIVTEKDDTIFINEPGFTESE
jgi:hypothetical protein